MVQIILNCMNIWDYLKCNQNFNILLLFFILFIYLFLNCDILQMSIGILTVLAEDQQSPQALHLDALHS